MQTQKSEMRMMFVWLTMSRMKIFLQRLVISKTCAAQ